MNQSFSSEARSSFSNTESSPDTNPASSFWSAAPAIHFATDINGVRQTDLNTEVRSRWTFNNLYLLFSCAFDTLHLKPNPDLQKETNELWNWDVAEIFVGCDWENIHRYKEFEVSPQGEWVDLDIDLTKADITEGWVWESGCEMAARIDDDKKVWHGFMRIPYPSIDTRPAAAGNLLRANFFRAHGTKRDYIAWQPPQGSTFHNAEAFGTLRLE